MKTLPKFSVQDILTAPIPPCYNPIEQGVCDPDWEGDVLDVLMSGIEPKDILWLLFGSGMKWLPSEVETALRIFIAKEAAKLSPTDELTARVLAYASDVFEGVPLPHRRALQVEILGGPQWVLYSSPQASLGGLVVQFVKMRAKELRTHLVGGIPEGIMDYVSDLLREVAQLELIGVLVNLCGRWRSGLPLPTWSVKSE